MRSSCGGLESYRVTGYVSFMELPIDDLLAALPAGRVLTEPEVLAAHCRDEADLCEAGMPLAVVRPRDTAEVAAAVRVAADTVCRSSRRERAPG